MSERDRTERLAEEIRAAVAETAPAGAPAPLADTASPEERAARRALDRALAHATPSIPAGARLSGLKRAAVRGLRFLWREQASFNTLVLDAIDALREGIATERRGRELDEDVIARADRAQREWTSGWERRAAIQDGRLARIESGAVATSPGTAAGPVPAVEGGSTPVSRFPPLPPGVYSLFEERFRGSTEDISRKQRVYLPHLAAAPGPVLDVGCGRGEFLRLLRDAGIAASGVEVNPIAAAACRADGLDVVEGDGFDDLASRKDGSLGAIVALQVVEHWTPEAIFEFLRESRRALAPGGLLVAETINTDSLSTWKAFFLDPSHVRPVPAEALRFLAESAGFVDASVLWQAPVSDDARLEEITSNDAKLNRLLFGPQDYALLARTPGATDSARTPGGAVSDRAPARTP